MSSNEISIVNPFSEETVFHVAGLMAGEVDSVVATARAAYRDWRGTHIAQRQALCTKVAAYFKEHQEAIARLYYLIDQKRTAGMLTGAYGVGKTMTLEYPDLRTD